LDFYGILNKFPSKVEAKLESLAKDALA